MLLYLQKCLEHAAGVTEEDRVKNCVLPSVGQYVDKLLAGINTEGTDGGMYKSSLFQALK